MDAKLSRACADAGTMDPSLLPQGVRSRLIDNGNGLKMHVLEAGFERGDSPCVVLLHGFPELAYTWRKLMRPLADAGFHVIAPDQRGYGYTTGWDDAYDADLSQFRLLNLVRDVLGLVAALDIRSVAAVVGHDFGSPVAAYCGLIRPDIFRAVALMSAPFAGPPRFGSGARRPSALNDQLAALDPPRKHYQAYYCSREANADMLDAEQGLHDFLRAYFHHKSGGWAQNEPRPLQALSAAELARMPTYYVMERDKGMAETVAAHMPTPAEVASCSWLSDEELAIYTETFRRTGFQGGLHWYRAAAHGPYQAELLLFSGRTLDVPACFIAGQRDWGVYQAPGAFERMQQGACSQLLGCHLVDGAGHWVQQEKPAEVSARLLAFLQEVTAR
jgi:pimeloyl-ACP methyl ester carboxylesterase